MEKPFAITLEVGSSRQNRTGSWRMERPVYVDRLPPCNDACPAGEDIQGWLYHAEGGDYEAAWRKLMLDNPLPAIMGRVCYHNCQTVCNRAQLDEAVGINSVERFLGDLAIAKNWKVTSDAPETGKSILIVGAGPSGLSAAYHLRLHGHQVTVYEAGPSAGGMMRFGIPKYRLPRDVLDAEVQRIAEMGVEFVFNREVDDLAAVIDKYGFDAVFLAIGAEVGKRAYIPAGDSTRILDAVSFLKSMESEDPPLLGRKVAIYGGGNTAMDAARTAKRLGATEAIVVYRRTRDRMPAKDIEVEEAEEEGIEMRWLSTIRHVAEGRLVIERMCLDESGWPVPTGEMEELEADSLILALGQEIDLTLLSNLKDVRIEDGVVQVDPHMMTGRPGVFAGGDMVPSERTVTTAIGHGKLAARNIDAYLQGNSYSRGERHEVATFEALNTWYYSDASKTIRPKLEMVRRQSTFEEVVQGLDETNALFEARRCLSCGNCFECDNCYGVCPDNSVIKLGSGLRYAFDYDYCKGCGICVKECPCGAIKMVPETI
ncbi:MAG: NAD(P)-binding protein [Ferrimicrobium sp.]